MNPVLGTATLLNVAFPNGGNWPDGRAMSLKIPLDPSLLMIGEPSMLLEGLLTPLITLDLKLSIFSLATEIWKE